MVSFGIVTPAVAVIVLIIALIIFGPGKLPELGKGLGKGIKEFRTATDLEAGNSKVQNDKEKETTV